MRTAMGLGLAIVAVQVLACGNKGQAPAAAAAPACTGVVERVEGDEWVVEACHEASVRIGQETKIAFTATGKPPWHINTERVDPAVPDSNPSKLMVVAAAGFAVATPELRAGAAVQLDEQVLRFELKLVPQAAGEQPVEFELKVPVCNSQAGTCVRRTATLRWTFAASGG
jgi:hypothetical protein